MDKAKMTFSKNFGFIRDMQRLLTFIGGMPVLAILLCFAVFANGCGPRISISNLSPHSNEDVGYDSNDDGTNDVVSIYKNGYVVKAVYDRNFDGKFDLTEYYQNGIPSNYESDENFDGIPDLWATMKFGYVAKLKIDSDFNGIPDGEYEYKNGIVSTGLWRPNGSNAPVRLELYTNGVCYIELIDSQGDGVFEQTNRYSFYGMIEKTE